MIDNVASRLREVQIHSRSRGVGYPMTMKNRLFPSKPRTGSLNHPRRGGRLRYYDRYTTGFSLRTDQSRIKWPTERELQQVSNTLVKVSRTGMRLEDAGDYFTSGDLAYQLQEILRATATLRKKSRRINS